MPNPYHAALALRERVQALGPPPRMKDPAASVYARRLNAAIVAANKATAGARFQCSYTGEWLVFCHIGGDTINIARPRAILEAMRAT